MTSRPLDDGVLGKLQRMLLKKAAGAIGADGGRLVSVGSANNKNPQCSRKGSW
jgi:hypothetical protein